MIVKLFSEALKKPQSFLWITNELKKSLFPFFDLPICGEKNGKKGLLTEKRCDSMG